MNMPALQCRLRCRPPLLLDVRQGDVWLAPGTLLVSCWPAFILHETHPPPLPHCWRARRGAYSRRRCPVRGTGRHGARGAAASPTRHTQQQQQPARLGPLGPAAVARGAAAATGAQRRTWDTTPCRGRRAPTTRQQQQQQQRPCTRAAGAASSQAARTGRGHGHRRPGSRALAAACRCGWGTEPLQTCQAAGGCMAYCPVCSSCSVLCRLHRCMPAAAQLLQACLLWGYMHVSCAVGPALEGRLYHPPFAALRLCLQLTILPCCPARSWCTTYPGTARGSSSRMHSSLAARLSGRMWCLTRAAARGEAPCCLF